MKEALGNGNADAILEHLRAYGELLTEHIKKEDEILFPWMDGNLSEEQRSALTGRFDIADAAGRELPQIYDTFITEMECKTGLS